MATVLHTLPGEPGEGEPSSAQIAEEERRAHLRERVMPLSQMLRVESEQAEPLLGPLVRRGLPTLLGAYGGHGKTTAGLAMVKAVVCGTEFLGFRGEGGCRALIVDLEQGISIAQAAVMKAFYPDDYEPGEPVPDMIEAMELGEHMERIHYADWQEGVTLSEPGPDLEVLEEIIARERPDVVMIDPVYKLFMGSDANENVVIGAFIREIDKLRVRYGFALILPMHPRKPPGQGGGTFTMHDLYGSAIWSWWAVVVLLLKRSVEGTTELRFEKDRTATLPVFTKWVLEYTPREGFKRQAGDVDPSDPTAMASRRAHHRIWDLLQRVAPNLVSRKDIEVALKMPPATVERATLKLVREHSDGQWPGLVIESGKPNLYGFKGEVDPVIAEVIREFGATEDPW